MKSATADALDLGVKIPADLARIVQMINDDQTHEAPIAVKAAAYRFGVSERTIQRAAEAGCGVRRRGRWYVFSSQILLPVVNP